MERALPGIVGWIIIFLLFAGSFLLDYNHEKQFNYQEMDNRVIKQDLYAVNNKISITNRNFNKLKLRQNKSDTLHSELNSRIEQVNNRSLNADQTLEQALLDSRNKIFAQMAELQAYIDSEFNSLSQGVDSKRKTALQTALDEIRQEMAQNDSLLTDFLYQHANQKQGFFRKHPHDKQLKQKIEEQYLNIQKE
ncbi:hypothetical protein IID20_02580 [Patescibacteria group bacterium]|nr:hypothetical protein [Patescibacteria group bacterium]